MIQQLIRLRTIVDSLLRHYSKAHRINRRLNCRIDNFTCIHIDQ